jgi:hypothetical protein
MYNRSVKNKIIIRKEAKDENNISTPTAKLPYIFQNKTSLSQKASHFENGTKIQKIGKSLNL